MHASFRIIRDDLNPAKVSELLGLSYDFSTEKGRAIEGRPNRKHPATTGIWSITSKNRIHSLQLEDHVQYLLDRLGNCEQALRQLKKQDSTISVWCAWFSALSSDGPVFSPACLERVAAFSADFEFDYYYTGD
jgi:hypothetical protein